MSAVRYRNNDGLELLVDDESPISDTPIRLIAEPYQELSLAEAERLLEGLARAIEDVRVWRRIDNK